MPTARSTPRSASSSTWSMSECICWNSSSETCRRLSESCARSRSSRLRGSRKRADGPNPRPHLPGVAPLRKPHRIHGLAEQVALEHVATERLEEPPLRDRLDAFRDDPQLETFTDTDHCRYQRLH